MFYILFPLTIFSFLILLYCNANAMVKYDYYISFKNDYKKSSSMRDEKYMRYYRMCYRIAKRQLRISILSCTILTIWFLLWGVMT